MRVFSRCLLAGCALLASVSGTRVHAACQICFQFLLDTSSCQGCGYYFTREGAGFLDASRMGGAYWALDLGNPAPGVGVDNGAWGPVNATIPWLRINATGAYLLGFWCDDPAIDGCIEGPPVPQPAKMVLLVTDADPPAPAARSYFAIACVQKNVNSNYNFGNVAGTIIDLKRIPKPVIAGASHWPDNHAILVLTVAPPVLPSAVYTDGACAPAASRLVTGYEILLRAIPRGDPPPGDRSRATGGWVDAAFASLGAGATITISCLSDDDVYLATSLVFNSGFQTDVVSENSTRVECGPNVADRPPSPVHRRGRPRGTLTLGESAPPDPPPIP